MRTYVGGFQRTEHGHKKGNNIKLFPQLNHKSSLAPRGDVSE